MVFSHEALLALATAWAVLSGCAVGNNGGQCTSGYSFTTSLASATTDHAAAPAGNQQKFTSIVAPTDSPAVVRFRSGC